ncbi:unnamed protein product [Hymenolepis diminuta]|nr:unnamed protein product [Hymenolepis diminuta]
MRYSRVCPYQNHTCNVCGNKGHRVANCQSDTKGQEKKKTNTGKASTALILSILSVQPLKTEVQNGGSMKVKLQLDTDLDIIQSQDIDEKP